MQAANETRSSSYQLTLVDSQFIPAVITPISGTASSTRRVVIPGAMISGDRVRPNPWNYSIENWSMRPCSYFRQMSSTTSASYTGPSQSGFYSVMPENLGREIDISYNNALTKFNEKIAGTLNLTVDVIQASQTVGLVNAAESLAKLARRLKRSVRDPRHWRDFLSGTGSIWLQWQYGYKPLVLTMYGLLDQMGGDGGGWVRPIRQGNSRNPRLPTSMIANFFGLPHQAQITGECSIRTSIQGCVALEGLNPQSVASFNPAVIAWELLPLSFVADWVIGIGDYLTNVETATKYAANWQFGHYTTSVKINASVTSRDTAGTYKQFSGGFDYNRISVSRVLLPQYPTPRPPQLDVDLGASRLLSAGALLSQLLR